MAQLSDDTEELTAEQLLERRVDAMMDDRRLAEPAAAVGNEPVGAPALPGHHHVTKPAAAPTKPRPAKPMPATTAQSASRPQPSPVTVEPINIDTPQSDAAIADIVAQEADTVLAAEDAGIAVAQDEAAAIEPPKQRGHPFFWFFIVLIVVLAAISAVLLVRPDLLP